MCLQVEMNEFTSVLYSKKKRMAQGFTSYKVTTKTCTVYLKVKLQEDKSRWCNYKLNCKKQHK